MTETRVYMEPARELPVFGSYDVIVAGGGRAGLAAALAAARNGAHTLVIERFACFGGSATAGLMAVMDGFRNQVAPDGLQTSRGIAEELVLALKAVGGLGRSPHTQRDYATRPGHLSFSYAFDTEKLKYLALKLLTEAGVQILFHTMACEPIKQGERVVGVTMENKSGRQAAFGRVIVDATGDADVAVRAGVPYWQTRHDEASRLDDTLMYKVAGFTVPHTIHGCVTDQSMVLWGPVARALDATNAQELTEAEIRARLSVYDDLDAKRAENAALDCATIVETPPSLGIRQTRFVRGLYTLTAHDVLAGSRFDDSIAMGSQPIVRFYGYRRYLEHEGYEIPYRCLVPQGVTHLLVAGRAMSSDQAAFESWRATATTMAIGEAAGTAAALAARGPDAPADLDVPSLQERLIAQGAEIGQSRRALP